MDAFVADREYYIALCNMSLGSFHMLPPVRASTLLEWGLPSEGLGRSASTSHVRRHSYWVPSHAMEFTCIPGPYRAPNRSSQSPNYRISRRNVERVSRLLGHWRDVSAWDS